MPNYIVTGANGQLARCFKALHSNFPRINLHFANEEDLDITNRHNLSAFFKKKSFDGIINCAAYTAVDQAENRKEEVHMINIQGVKNITEICQLNNLKLVHFSTDYVFDGSMKTFYKETDQYNPLGVYGQSKAKGEEIIFDSNINAVVVRTSWLFSPYGKNFLKTILNLAKSKKTIQVVNDQFGRPTSGLSLARNILNYIEHPDFWKFRCFHFANKGKASWYDLAKEIIIQQQLDVKIEPIQTKDYPTTATRPKNAVLSTNRIENTLHLTITNWQTALKECLGHI